MPQQEEKLDAEGTEGEGAEAEGAEGGSSKKTIKFNI